MGIHVLAQEVLQKSSIEECSVPELEALVNRYPYFAPARFLYAQKLQKEGSASSENALSKAILYYPSPLSFFEFIQPERFEIESVESEEWSVEEEEKEKEKEKEEELVLVPDIKEEEEEQEEKEKEKEEEKEEEFVLVPDIEEDEEHGVESEEQSESDGEERMISIPQIREEPIKEGESLFMPYHTVDYFASQGIKLGQNETTNDRFGKQLLSFTEWLKTLKKGPALSPEPSTQHPEPLPTDRINTADIYTEAMAEVWIKQGNKEKALEVYNKLSLLYPSKKAYFAAKIDHLSKT